MRSEVALNIIKGKSHPAGRIAAFGPHGVGKSSWACSHRKVLALDFENGLNEIGPDRITMPRVWGESMPVIREACIGPGDHEAVVIDTVDKLEAQCASAVCIEGKKKTLADFDWGQGHAAEEVKWRELLSLLEGARDKGRTVILVAHVQSKEVKDPTLGTYSRYIAAMNAKPWAATAQWCDAVLFMNYQAGMYEGRAVMTGDRVIYAQAGTGYDAKNRWNLPREMPLYKDGKRYGWQDFEETVKAMQREPQDVIGSIRKLVPKDSLEHAEKTLLEIGSDVPKLIALETALKKRVMTA